MTLATSAGPLWLLATGVREAVGSRLVQAIHPAEGFPAWAEDDGIWRRSHDGNWLGGFAVARHWDCVAPDGRRSREQAEERRLLRSALAGLAPLLERPTAFNGFVFHYAAMHGALHTGDGAATEMALAAAGNLARLMHPTTGVIALGEPELDDGDEGEALTYIDPLGPITALLAWAGRMNGDHELVERAGRAVRWHLDGLVRDDGSVAQAAYFDCRSGRLLRAFTGDQGYSPDSTWSRSPAWAVLGAALAAHWIPEMAGVIIELITPAASWWMEQLPQGDVPPWDFDAPDRAVLDTSASAIAVVGLLRLAANDRCPGELGTRWRTYAQAAFVRLTDSLVMRPDGAGLSHSCYHKQRAFGVDAETVWGDWYLYEAASLIANLGR